MKIFVLPLIYLLVGGVWLIDKYCVTQNRLRAKIQEKILKKKTAWNKKVFDWD